MNGYRESTVCTLIQPDGYTSSAQTPHALDTAPLLRASLCVRRGAHVCILMWKTEINRSVVRMLFLTRWSQSQNLCVRVCVRASVGMRTYVSHCIDAKQTCCTSVCVCLMNPKKRCQEKELYKVFLTHRSADVILECVDHFMISQNMFLL